MFIPQAPSSGLKRSLAEMEAQQGFPTKVRFVEKLGSTIGDILENKDLLSGHCHRDDCFPSKSKPGKCFRKNVLYEIVCEGCRGEGKTTKYFGETARTGYDRGAEHWKSRRTGEKGHFLTKHKEETLRLDFL